MTNTAFGGSVVLAVTADAISHVQDAHLAHPLHIANVTVARRTFKTGAYVRLVEKAYVVGHSVDSHPIDHLLVDPGALDVLDRGGGHLGLFPNHFVAEHALLDRGHRRGSPLGYIAVAEHAVDLVVLDVRDVAKGYRLSRTRTGYDLTIDDYSTNYSDN